MTQAPGVGGRGSIPPAAHRSCGAVHGTFEVFHHVCFGASDQRLKTVCSRVEASGFLVGPAVFKTDVGAQALRRVRFPSVSAQRYPPAASSSAAHASR